MKKAILLLNVGTPLSPQVADVKRYLTEFLLDPRVITKQALLRQLLVRGIIVPFRKRKSAKLYQAIWTEKGSPLLTHTIDLKNSLQELLRSEYIVEAAMRYQEPTIDQALHRLQKERLSHLIVVPLFPQYASATTGSSIEAVMQKMARWDHFPQKIVFLNQFWNDQHFIDAFVESAKKWPIQNYDKILFSFHGLPQEQDRASATHTSYQESCIQTAQAIAEKLKIEPFRYTVSFQSRLGRQEWLQPYTSTVLKTLAAQGTKKILVLCPSFVADCLETVHEIGIEAKEEFCHAGGRELHLVKCPNADPNWVKGLKNMILRTL